MWNITQRDDIYQSPFENSGGEFKNNVFEVRAYDWNEESKQNWNFKYNDIRISWYKYLGRGSTINKDLRPEDAIKMFNECLKSVKEMDIDIIKEATIQKTLKVDGINIKSLNDGDKYRPVIYVATGKDKVERGWISSWNEHFIFVRYHPGDTSAATDPEDLEFIDYKASGGLDESLNSALRI
jgi:hypothetical protein